MQIRGTAGMIRLTEAIGGIGTYTIIGVRSDYIGIAPGDKPTCLAGLVWRRLNRFCMAFPMPYTIRIGQRHLMWQEQWGPS